VTTADFSQQTVCDATTQTPATAAAALHHHRSSQLDVDDADRHTLTSARHRRLRDGGDTTSRHEKALVGQSWWNIAGYHGTLFYSHLG